MDSQWFIYVYITYSHSFTAQSGPWILNPWSLLGSRSDSDSESEEDIKPTRKLFQAQPGSIGSIGSAGSMGQNQPKNHRFFLTYFNRFLCGEERFLFFDRKWKWQGWYFSWKGNRARIGLFLLRTYCILYIVKSYIVLVNILDKC